MVRRSFSLQKTSFPSSFSPKHTQILPRTIRKIVRTHNFAYVYIYLYTHVKLRGIADSERFQAILPNYFVGISNGDEDCSEIRKKLLPK